MLQEYALAKNESLINEFFNKKLKVSASVDFKTIMHDRPDLLTLDRSYFVRPRKMRVENQKVTVK